MITFSITSSDIYGQQALITTVATEALPDDFDYEEAHRLDTMFNAISSEIIQVYSPHLLIEADFLVYTNTNPNTSPLKPISVEAQTAVDYRWRAISADTSLEVTVIRKPYGFAGSVIDHASNKLYRYFPVDTSYSILLEMPEETVSCSVGKDDEDVTGDAEEPDVDPEECLGEPCPGHIDILIMITQSARNWIGAYPEAILDMAIADLNSSLENSNIAITVAYSYIDIDDYDLSGQGCFRDVDNINSDQTFIDLVSNGSSDLAIVLGPPGLYRNSNAESCTSVIGPDPSAPVGIVPVDIVLTDYIFVHEVGHLLGAGHYNRSSSNPTVDCAADYAGSVFRTIIESITITRQKVPYFSNPNVLIEGEPTGTPNRNNAGRMNEFGCIIESFNPSQLITTQIEIDVIDCVLELDALVSTASNFSYEWYWNETGFFDNPSSSSFLGTSVSVSTIAPPITDPCSSFFVHVKVLENGIVISQRTIRLNGGLCSPYEPCNLPSYPLRISSSDEIEKIFVWDMLGRKLFEKPPSTSLESLNKDLSKGLYVISTFFKDGTLESSIQYISN